MYAKLQLDRDMTTFDEIESTWEGLPDGPARQKVNALRGLYVRMDRYIRRKEFVTYYGISSKTLQRAIHKFNDSGLAGIVESPPGRPGRKRKIDQFDFHNRILPAAQRAVRAEGDRPTMRDLFRSAQSFGIFPGSYSTFRRCLGMVNKNYERAQKELTIEEWLLGNT